MAAGAREERMLAFQIGGVLDETQLAQSLAGGVRRDLRGPRALRRRRGRFGSHDRVGGPADRPVRRRTSDSLWNLLRGVGGAAAAAGIHRRLSAAPEA